MPKNGFARSQVFVQKIYPRPKILPWWIGAVVIASARGTECPGSNPTWVLDLNEKHSNAVFVILSKYALLV
jgi:hypothetical protein